MVPMPHKLAIGRLDRPITASFVENPIAAVLVISDDKGLNEVHRRILCRRGFTVFTTITYTDVREVFTRFNSPTIDAVVVASIIHGWHHEEGEEIIIEEIPQSYGHWHSVNIKRVVDFITAEQRRSPLLIIAQDLLGLSWYSISDEILKKLGLSYQTYRASDPKIIVEILTTRREI